MRTLCIDTSGPAAIAIVEDGTTLAITTETDSRKHAESMAVLLQNCLSELPPERDFTPSLKESNIDRICVGTGPGPFTGLRAGIVFAATLGRGLGVQVLGIGSLDGLARQAFDQTGNVDGFAQGPILVATDAKRREIYWGLYDPNNSSDVSILSGPNVGPISDALKAAAEMGAVRIVAPVPVLEALQADPLFIDLDLPAIPMQLDPSVFSGIADAREGEEMPLTPLYLRRPDIHGQPTALI